MNILLECGLPEEYEGIPLLSDFRNMIRVDLIMRDKDLNEHERSYAMLLQLYGEIPKDINTAIEGLGWFFRCGQAPADPAKESGSKKAAKKGFSFEQDANLIYSAFYSTYGISLSTIEFLHWWEFMALFEGLPETTMIKRIMHWRTCDVAKLPKAERKHIMKMRSLFAIKDTDNEQLSVEEIEQNAKDAFARRYEEAERWAAQQAALKNG